MTHIGSGLALGFVLGVQHATDPDHLVAVATVVTREQRFGAGALVGTFWGLGHAVTVAVVGGLIIALGVRVPESVGRWLELGVAGMLVGLGAARLRDAMRGWGGVSREHIIADHDHNGREAFHSHGHEHSGLSHRHPHVHPSGTLLSALTGRQPAARAFMVGTVHGLAGSAAVALLVVAALPSAWAAAAYLLVFGAGTVAGMTALTSAMALPVAVALRVRWVPRALALGAGIGSVAFGVVYAVRLL